MDRNRPLILISNDDGVDALGLQKITEALRDLGDLVVFAPDSPRSGMSCAITAVGPIAYQMLKQEEGLTVYSCTGTPNDCVKLVLSKVLPKLPNLIVSGINHGGNHALSVHYSGTVGAALEGCVFGVPSMSISLYHFRPEADFSESCRIGRFVAEQLLQQGLPRGIFLNLNIPNIPQVKGLAVGRQSAGKWHREFEREEDSAGHYWYWLSGDFEISGPDYPDNDVTLLKNGYASIVPCHIDMTDYAFQNELKSRLEFYKQPVIFEK